jgi:hypothetical protein
LERRINWIRKDDPLFDFRYRGKQSGIVGILKNRGVGIDEINYTASVLRSKFFDQSSDDFLVSGYKLSELYVPNDQSVGCYPQLQKLNNLPDFVRVNPTTCTIEIRKGTHVLSANLVIPSKFSLVVSSGAQLLLEHGSFIISRSPIYFHGTIEEPVSISAVDSGGGGILVIDAGERSELEYVKFSGLSNGNTLPYFLNGAVTFYRSDVTIDSSTFDSNVAGDDYLNIIASRYVIKNSQFRNTVSDGFDSDYSDGRIENVVLENIGLDEQSGGDGLDFSGSNALIRNVRLNEISDKALSVGESSVVKIEDVIIDNTTNAIVSKDGSVVEVKNAVLTNLERGLIAIKKKSGYGPAKLSATGTTLSSVAIPYLLEEGSTMRINGVDITSNTKNGKAIIYQ